MRQTMNNGVFIEITARIDMQMKASRRQTWKKLGILLSIDSMSLEHRFKMRPIGVDSKNFISHRRIDMSKASWSFLAALTKIQIEEKSAANMKIPELS
jgi:hypothetical protein